MKNYLVLIIFTCCISSTVISQNKNGDSLYSGRVCKLVLFNGYQTEGKITNRGVDTVSLQTDLVKLFIPVKDIKFVLNPDVELSDLEEIDTLNYKTINITVVKIDTTDECDIYMNDKSVLAGVELVKDTDTSIMFIKNKRSKVINISGIRKIVFKPSAPFGNGYLVGSVAGFFLGFSTLAFRKPSGEYHIGGIGQGILFGLICSIPAGLIGGVIGVLSASDDVYLFENGIYSVKIKRIFYAMEKHY